MPSPLLVVMLSATSVAGVAVLPGAADTTPDTSDAEPVVECVLPSSDPAGTSEPIETTEPVATSEPIEQTPAEAFFDGFCHRAQEVAGVGPFLSGAPTLDSAEQFRTGMCDPGFNPPSHDQSAINWVIYLRGTSQSDTEMADAWLEAGVLTDFDKDDDDATEVSEDVLTELVDIEMAFLDEFDENHDAWCADLLETVDTTEA